MGVVQWLQPWAPRRALSGAPAAPLRQGRQPRGRPSMAGGERFEVPGPLPARPSKRREGSLVIGVVAPLALRAGSMGWVGCELVP